MDALVIGCSDGRATVALRRLLEAEGVAEADRIIVPGGPLQLTRPGPERRFMLDGMRQLVDPQDIRRIYLVSHQDCAAYERALGGFGFDQQELLERDLRRVKTLLETTFPGIDVRCFFLPWQEDDEGAAYGPAVPVE